jgi:para-aminobenzoate synthetase component 1
VRRGEISRWSHGTDGPPRDRVARESPRRARLYRWRVRHSDIVASGLIARLPPGAPVAAVRRGRSTVVGVDPTEVVTANGADAFAMLDALVPGFWVGWCAFELGHAAERVVSRGASLEAPSVPDVAFARFDAVAVVDEHGGIRVRGDGPGRIPLERAALDTPIGAVPELPDTRWTSGLDRDAHRARVESILELLRAGVCYQVNLTRRLTCGDAVDPIALYGALTRTHPAPHTALLRLPGVGPGTAVVSASPERFLRVRSRQVETRPIKGTAATRMALRASSKDHAENVMIVDLARNDLGRVCEAGSVHVPSLCSIESHPGLHHLVSTVRGRLRDDVGIGTLVGATFPPASVTGAPKPRVLQAIEDLEPVRRGVYCGALGWIDTSAAEPGRVEADLAVAIRTFTVLGAAGAGSTQFGVGGGIVADSQPDAEWDETELKAARLLRVAGAEAGALVAT